MIDKPLEKLTAHEAVAAGLIDAIKSGEAKVTGIYTVDKNCKVNFHQQNILFTDVFENIRLIKFADNSELITFWEYLGEEISGNG